MKVPKAKAKESAKPARESLKTKKHKAKATHGNDETDTTVTTAVETKKKRKASTAKGIWSGHGFQKEAPPEPVNFENFPIGGAHGERYI